MKKVPVALDLNQTGKQGNSTKVRSSENGEQTILWSSNTDISGVDRDNVYFRIRAVDADTGFAAIGTRFTVDNCSYTRQHWISLPTR